MPGITDLGSASSVAAGDQLAISQSGVDRRVTADKFAVVSLANTFAAAQTMPQIKQPQTVFAANQTIGVGLPLGLRVIINARTGAQGLIWLSGGANNVASISLRGGMSLVKDTANSINIYHDATYGYVVQNKYATSQTVAYLVIGIG